MTEQDLKQYRALKIEIDELEESLIRLSGKIQNPKIPMPSQSAPGTRRTLDDSLIEFEGLRASYAKKIGILLKKRKEVENAIDKVHDPEQRILLRSRYIDGMTWEEVAVKLHYRMSKIYELRNKALVEILKPRSHAESKP